MAPRKRVPSTRAVQAVDGPARSATRKTSSTTTKKATASKGSKAKSASIRRSASKKGKGTQDEEDADEQEDMTLYCICLGYDTGKPMIQCEDCGNWFHFECINIKESTAARIESYICDMCHEMGGGETKYIEEKPSPPPESSADDDSGDDPTVEFDEDARPSKKAKSDAATKGKKRKRPLAEDYEAWDSEEDGDYVGDDGDFPDPSAASERKKSARRNKKSLSRLDQYESTDASDSDAEDGERKRKKSSTKRKPSKATAQPAPRLVGPDGPAVPASDKTRTHVTKQLAGILVSIFAATDSQEQDEEVIESNANEFAKEIEQELFADYGEADPKGVKAPRTKYSTKFRSLHYNLKTNAHFRARIGAKELSASRIVNMSQEDLLTPELRAMAESVRAASLKHSVKEALSVPKSKLTHKGEEEIESAAQLAVAEEQALDRDRRSESARDRDGKPKEGSFSPSQSPALESIGAMSPPVDAKSPDYSRDESHTSLVPDSPARDRSQSASRPSVSFSARDLGLGVPEGGSNNDSGTKEGPMLPPAPKERSASFDLASVWGQIKTDEPAKESKEDAMEVEQQSQENKSGTPIDFDNIGGANVNDDFDLSALESNQPEIKTGKSTTPTHSPPAIAAAAEQTVALRDLPTIWSGDLIVPEEGGFPAIAVQAGGRPLVPSPDVWSKIIPHRLAMEGRLDIDTATKYLVDCSFAPTREIVVVAVLPDLRGPDEHAPHKPNAESCLQKHAHIVNHYTSRKRVGALAVPSHLKPTVKDFYVVPVKKDAPLPEFVELLDDCSIPETGKRDSDLLLFVAVVQKNLFPTYKPPKPAPSQAAAPVVSAPLNTNAANPIATANLGALSALLQNPAALQQVFASGNMSALSSNPNLSQAVNMTPGAAEAMNNLTMGMPGAPGPGGGPMPPFMPPQNVNGPSMMPPFIPQQQQQQRPFGQSPLGPQMGGMSPHQNAFGGGMTPPAQHGYGGGMMPSPPQPQHGQHQQQTGGAFVHPSRLGLMGAPNAHMHMNEQPQQGSFGMGQGQGHGQGGFGGQNRGRGRGGFGPRGRGGQNFGFMGGRGM